MSRVMYQVRPNAYPTPEAMVQGREMPAGMSTWRHGGGVVHKMAKVHWRAFVGVEAEVGSSAKLGRNVSVEDKAVADGYGMGWLTLRGAARTEPGSYITDGRVTLGGNVVVESGTRLSGRNLVIDGNVILRGVDIRGDHLTIIGSSSEPMVIDENILPEALTLGPGWVITDLRTLQLISLAMDSQYEPGRDLKGPTA